jgi:hypothetical protein
MFTHRLVYTNLLKGDYNEVDELAKIIHVLCDGPGIIHASMRLRRSQSCPPKRTAAATLFASQQMVTFSMKNWRQIFSVSHSQNSHFSDRFV